MKIHSLKAGLVAMLGSMAAFMLGFCLFSRDYANLVLQTGQGALNRLSSFFGIS